MAPTILMSVLFALILTFDLASAAITFNGTRPPSELQFLPDSQTLELTNHLRPSGKVKIQLKGATISEVHQSNPKLHEINTWYLHLSDGNQLDYSYSPPVKRANGTRYNFKWHNRGGDGHSHQMCIQLGANSATWYNGFLERPTQRYVIDTNMPEIPNPTPMLADSSDSKQGPFGPMLEPTLLSSDGFALLLPTRAAAFITRNKANNDLCLSINGNQPPYRLYNDSQSHEIYFSIIAAPDLVTLHSILINWIHNTGIPSTWNDQKASATIMAQFRTPFWNLLAQLNTSETVDSLNQIRVEDFSKAIKAHGFLTPNTTLVMDGKWERLYGALTFDPVKFPNAHWLDDTLHKAGHLLRLVIHPFMEQKLVDSLKVEEQKKLLFLDPSTGKPIQVQGPYNSSLTGALIDFTQNYAAMGYVRKAAKLVQNQTGVAGFRLTGGTIGFVQKFKSSNGGKPYQFPVGERFRSPNKFSFYTAVAGHDLGPGSEVETGFKTQSSLTLFRIGDLEPEFYELQNMLNQALTLTTAGYALIVPGVFKPFLQSKKQPTEELYIRLVQLAAFFPFNALSTPPWIISQRAVSVTQKMLSLHQEHAPVFDVLLKNFLKSGDPLIRPLWFLDPWDSKTFKITDQFAVGSDLVVAPVMVAGATSRQVYLPKGTWVDQHGQKLNGGSEVKVSAPLEELPYFKRVV